MSLSNKYRPKELDEMVGNEDTIAQLESILSRDEGIPHAFLLSGPSGCGKTTLARIIAERLGCHRDDFMEMDSADMRGIDTVREIRRQMKLHPLSGPCRVWLLDECHQLTKDAQEALLKGLEDAPEHVYFIMATTEPDKLIKTVRNRCSHFMVESLSWTVIKKDLLINTCKGEIRTVPDEVLVEIAKAANGSCRAALVMLDKIIDLDEDEMLGAVEAEQTIETEAIELCRCLMGGKWDKAKKILKGLQKQDPERIRRAVLGYANAVTLGDKQSRKGALILECFSEPTYNTGHPGLTLAAYQVFYDLNKN